MQRSTGCLRHINTTVIAFGEEGEHKGPQRCVHAQVYISTNQIVVHKDGGVDSHITAHTLCSDSMMGKENVWEEKQGEMIFLFFSGNFHFSHDVSVMYVCPCLRCVAWNSFKHRALLINMVISKQQGVVRTAAHY